MTTTARRRETPAKLARVAALMSRAHAGTLNRKVGKKHYCEDCGRHWDLRPLFAVTVNDVEWDYHEDMTLCEPCIVDRRNGRQIVSDRWPRHAGGETP